MLAKAFCLELLDSNRQSNQIGVMTNMTLGIHQYSGLLSRKDSRPFLLRKEQKREANMISSTKWAKELKRYGLNAYECAGQHEKARSWAKKIGWKYKGNDSRTLWNRRNWCRWRRDGSPNEMGWRTVVADPKMWDKLIAFLDTEPETEMIEPVCTPKIMTLKEWYAKLDKMNSSYAEYVCDQHKALRWAGTDTIRNKTGSSRVRNAIARDAWARWVAAGKPGPKLEKKASSFWDINGKRETRETTQSWTQDEWATQLGIIDVKFREYMDERYAALRWAGHPTMYLPKDCEAHENRARATWLEWRNAGKPKKCKKLDVGVDCGNYHPVSLDQTKAALAKTKQPPKPKPTRLPYRTDPVTERRQDETKSNQLCGCFGVGCWVLKIGGAVIAMGATGVAVYQWLEKI